LTIAAVAVGAALMGCGRPPVVGDVLLRVTLDDGVKVDVVDYQITEPERAVDTGDIKSASPSSSFSRLISHVPVGTGYVVAAKATSSDGKLICQAMTVADVRRGSTTLVNLALPCKDANSGDVNIVINAIVCPDFEITSYTVSPLVASVGGKISVSVSTNDPDGEVVSFQWSAPLGTFASSTEMATTYSCAAPGTVALTVSAALGTCEASKTVEVSCLERDGGID
jgi:hypothetical protein